MPLAPHYEDSTVILYHADCLAALQTMPDASLDSVVTDPPYGLEFMGKEWDGADGFRRSLNRRRDPVEAVKASGEDAGLFGLLDGEAI